MKLSITSSAIDSNPAVFMRSAGYTFIHDRRSGHDSFIREIGGVGRYPRFHVYIKENGDNIVFDMHLDQKQAIYEGVTAHSGEYDGPLVEQEIARLRSLMRPGRSGGSRSSSPIQPADPSDERSRRWSNMLRGA